MVSRFARLSLIGGAASVVLGISMKTLGDAVFGARLAQLDDDILRAVAARRTGWLNGAAADFTALGSGTLLIIATVLVLLILLSTRDRYGATHLALASLGAMFLTSFFKHYFARPRPAVVEHLVKVSLLSGSYPSGHALGTAACYFSFALVARRHLPRHRTRELLIGTSLLTIVLVCASRVYLGVHYASDVLAGVLIGAGWSLLLAGVFSMVERARLRRSVASIVADPENSRGGNPQTPDITAS